MVPSPRVDQSLRERRGDLEHAWQAAVIDHRPAPARPEVLASWNRSSTSVATDISAAPVEDPGAVARRWAESPLGRASRVIHDDLHDLAAGGDMMAALTDEHVRIAWLAGGRTMSQRAERVHFCLGGRWSEDAVGTNALALAERTGQLSTVFSAEHFAPIVHDWVCYSAPITDPQTGRFLGVIDLSTVWQKAHPTLMTTVGALARCVEYELRSMAPAPEPVGRDWPPDTGIALRTLGQATVTVDRGHLPVTPRQFEILTVLALHPQGLTLDELIGRVYGDRPVNPSTVKAELSRLRHLLGGRIGSRPYRLVGPVAVDTALALSALEAGDVATALELGGGPMLPLSDSPEVRYWRDQFEVALRDAVIGSADPELLTRLSGLRPDDVAVHEAALGSLDGGDHRRSLVLGRLSAGRMD